MGIRQGSSRWGCRNKMEIELSLDNRKGAIEALQVGQLYDQKHGKGTGQSQYSALCTCSHPSLAPEDSGEREGTIKL